MARSISPHFYRLTDAQSKVCNLIFTSNYGDDANFSPKGSLLARNDTIPESRTKSITRNQNMTKSVNERARAAAIVLNRYRIEYKNDWDLPQSILHSQVQMQTALERDVPIELVIPAFPFKSSNRSMKVLSPLPDEAERLSLLHLDGLCSAIADATCSQTFLTIISDGIIYNDILGVSDQEVWRYGQQLRQMAKSNGCHRLRFLRISDLVGADDESSRLNETLYLSRVSEYRSILESNTPSGFDVLHAITNDPDITKTYKGYKKFLISERDDRTNRSRSQMERENSVIAKAMILRGKAFAEAVKLKFPDSIRLSIHPSNDINKVSIAMLPQDNEIVMTPWHGAVVRGVNARVSMSHAILIPAMTHDIVHVGGHPSYFRERSDLFTWPNLNVKFEYLYPCGILVTPAESTSTYTVSMVDMQRIQILATYCSPVILRGFFGGQDCVPLASNPEDITLDLPRKNDNPVLSTNISIHCNSMAKNNTTKQREIYQDPQTSSAPQSQFSILSISAPVSTGSVFFASFDLFSRYLPRAYPVSKLEKIKWTYCYPGSPPNVNESIPLVVRHPVRNLPCIRWHRSWPQWRKPGASANISIVNGSQSLVPLVDSLLADHRVCLRFRGQEGDIVVVDNFTVLYTTTT
ncbi:Clavaminate synthase-like protein [Xylaria bambusicola]|uniref:Clavaminate synthase-like protein n=1 Tax=Xylaria bambusicola TaxID=326684 RepID=UPI00200861CF|nr:Clavaminate synthase-like protein [Xylaria bambusicola]KAI0521488.1 Clavaminate synthase-like protein [Xylaria bambusicola]